MVYFIFFGDELKYWEVVFGDYVLIYKSKWFD